MCLLGNTPFAVGAHIKGSSSEREDFLEITAVYNGRNMRMIAVYRTIAFREMWLYTHTDPHCCCMGHNSAIDRCTRSRAHASTLLLLPAHLPPAVLSVYRLKPSSKPNKRYPLATLLQGSTVTVPPTAHCIFRGVGFNHFEAQKKAKQRELRPYQPSRKNALQCE